MNLEKILKKHEMWLKGEEGGECADLSGVDLRCANLRNTNLECADLSDANLYKANLDNAMNYY